MDYGIVISWAAGLLQFLVAVYALRLNRLFGTKRAGWSLFCAFTLLAVSHLVQSFGPLKFVSEFTMSVDVIYGLISLLLLTGMLNIEAWLKFRERGEAEKQQVLAQLAGRVKDRTADLAKANEDLTKTNEELLREVTERKRIAGQMELTYQELLEANRQAGMSEVATSVLHNVGNVLNSVNISATVVNDHVEHFKASSVVRVAELMKEHGADLGDYITRDPKGKQLPTYIGELGEHLMEEQKLLIKEIGFVKKKIEHIKEIIAMQQNYAQFNGVTETVKVCDLVEDALQMNADALARHDVDILREFDHTIPEITVEKHKVLQVLVNLIRNAKYACDESGRKDKQMKISVSTRAARIHIKVSDNGVGIPLENLQKIFKHGFTTRKGGHGFGLHGGALAAVEMGGALLVNSDGPGKGASFTLELPMTPTRAFLKAGAVNPNPIPTPQECPAAA